MASRRKKQASRLTLLLKAPWVVSAGFAVTILIASQLIAPLLFAAHPLAAVIGRGVIPLGLITSIVLGLIAAGLYFKQRNSLVGPKWERGVSPYGIGSLSDSDSGSRGLDRRRLDRQPLAHEAITKPTEWSAELFYQYACNRDSKHVEELVAAYFREKTFRTETGFVGADGEINFRLFIKDSAVPFAMVRCVAGDTQTIVVESVRVLLAAMTHDKIAKGILVTTSVCTEEAIDFAKALSIKLISGDMLLKGILALPADAQRRLLDVATNEATSVVT